MKYALITVDYNSHNHTYELLSSLNNFKEVNLDIIIVYCGNCNGNLKINTHHNLKIIEPKKNLGYFGGIKFGLQQINISLYNKIIVCNNDITFKNFDFFKKIKKINDTVIAPRIISSAGINQNPHNLNKPSKLRMFYYKIYFLNFFLAKIIFFFLRFRKRHTNTIININEPLRIFSPHGAFIIFSNDYFYKGGYIDDGFFLYGEEDSIAGICNEIGAEVVYHPEIEVHHFEGGTMGTSLSKFKYYNQKLANKYIISKYSIFK